MMAEKFDKEGFVVFAGCLDTESQGVLDLKAKCSEKLRIVELDVTSDKSVSSAGEYVRANLEDHGEFVCSVICTKCISDIRHFCKNHTFTDKKMCPLNEPKSCTNETTSCVIGVSYILR